MKKWQKRLIKEKNGLQKKINKHDNFIDSNYLDGLYYRDIGLLCIQLDIMCAYLDVLDERIEIFNL
jgi:hypothetical protein